MWSDYVVGCLYDDLVWCCLGYIKGKALLPGRGEVTWIQTTRMFLCCKLSGDCGELDSIVE